MIRKLILLLNVAFIPVVDLTRILEWFAGIVKTVVVWAIVRLFIISLFLVILPIAIYKGWLLIAQKLMEASTSMAGTGGFWDGAILEYTDLGAWLASQLKFPECMAVMVGALLSRFALSFIRR